MNYVVLQRRIRLVNLTVALLLTMLLTSSCIQPAPLDSVLSDPLYGSWDLADDDANGVTMIFTPDGVVTMVMAGNLETLSGTFALDHGQQPAHLDIDLEEVGQVATIVDFPDDTSMRIADSQPGQTRPTSFDDGLALFVRRGGRSGGVAAETLVSPGAETGVQAMSATDNRYLRGASLAAFLSYVPNVPAYRHRLNFGDYDAWLEAWGLSRPANFDEVISMTEAEKALWTGALISQTTPPAALNIHQSGAESMADKVGFDLFGADQYLEAGLPPVELSVISPGDGDEVISQTLVDAGYKTSLDGDPFVLYSLRGDYEVDYDSETFIGQLGELNRIAVSDERLIIGRATDIVSDALAAKQDGSTLADDPAYQALLRSLDAPVLDDAGALVGMILQTDFVPVDMAEAMLGNNPTEEILAQWEAFTTQEPPFPRYVLTGLATYRAPNATYLAVHAVFSNNDAAETAAAVLAERLEGYVGNWTNEPLPWSVVDSVVDGETAIVLLRVDEETMQPGRLSWHAMTVLRDLAFLVTE